MKRFFTMLIVIAMVLSLGIVTASAATTNVTISGVSDRDYEAFKLMSASTDGTNYAYVVNDVYKDILIDVLGLASTATGQDIVDKISEIHNASDMRKFADSVYNEIKAAGITAEASWHGETTTLEQAYWLVADVTDLSGTNLNNSLVMVDTVGNSDVTINAKPSTITTWKKVDDENDSLIDPTPTSEDGVNLQDVADYDIGDEVPFTIDVRVPNNITNYSYYALVMEDYVEKGLTYIPSSFKIYVGDVESTIGAKGTPDVKFYYEIVTEEDADGNQVSQKLYVYPAFGYTTHELDTATSDPADYVAKAASKEDGGDYLKVFAAGTSDGSINSSVIKFTYNCLLNENAKIGIEGNPNKYKLRYSNNPYDDGFGETPEDVNIILTYRVVFNKVDGNGNKLTGADFELSKFIAKADGAALTQSEAEALGYVYHEAAVAWGVFESAGVKTIEDADATVFSFKGLDDGFYKIEETVVPNAYNGIEPIEFRITADHITVISGEPLITDLRGETKISGELTFAADSGTGTLTTSIENNTGIELPTTGGFGTTMMYVCGIALVAFAVVVLVTRKRMAIGA